MAAPGRLNIDSRAEWFGMIAPCDATLSFFIARNTQLRSITGRLRISAPSLTLLEEAAMRVALSPTTIGMLAADQPLPRVSGRRCLELAITLDRLMCCDKDGDRIDCPDIRIKATPVFAALQVTGDALNICGEPQGDPR